MSTAVADQVLEQAVRSGDDAARLELGNRWLSRHRYGTPEHERGLELLLAASEGPLAVQAHWFLAAYYVQLAVRPGAAAEAARWMSRAADAGMPAAMDRLAEMYLAGRGVEPSAARAFELQKELAGQGHSRAAWEAGYLLDHAGVEPDGPGGEGDTACTFFARASALGDPAGYYSLGLRFVAGTGVAADPDFGRALLSRAADGGYPGAADAADELVPGVPSPRATEWHRRLKSNMDSAPLEALGPGRVGAAQRRAATLALEAHFSRIGHPALRLDAGGRLRVTPGGTGPVAHQPGNWHWLSHAPRVATSSDFASREECDHLMSRVAGTLRKAGEYRRAGRDNDDAEALYFSGSGQAINAMAATSVVRIVEQRIARMTDWSPRALEPCSVIRYLPGEEYRPHVDFFSPDQIERDRREGRDFGGQRIATFLVCLRAPAAGGETVYDKAGLSVAGQRGQGVLHYNVGPDGHPDPMSLHTGMPVRDGEKWLWRSTLREHCLDVPR